jgi:hypothetical protein
MSCKSQYPCVRIFATLLLFITANRIEDERASIQRWWLIISAKGNTERERERERERGDKAEKQVRESRVLVRVCSQFKKYAF